MRSERGQATVEWVGLVLLVALALGFVASRAGEARSREDRRGLGDLLAQRIALAGGAVGEGAPEARAGASRPGSGERPSGGAPREPPLGQLGGRPLPARGELGAAPPLVPLRGRELIRAGARKAVALNGLVCYLRKSTAAEDTNRVGDDIGDAVNCLNPLNGWTGELGGTDD
jgi:hypothetical protein